MLQHVCVCGSTGTLPRTRPERGLLSPAGLQLLLGVPEVAGGPGWVPLGAGAGPLARLGRRRWSRSELPDVVRREAAGSQDVLHGAQHIDGVQSEAHRAKSCRHRNILRVSLCG